MLHFVIILDVHSGKHYSSPSPVGPSKQLLRRYARAHPVRLCLLPVSDPCIFCSIFRATNSGCASDEQLGRSSSHQILRHAPRNGDDLHPMFGQFPCVRPVHLHPVRFTPLVAAGAWAFVFPPGEADCHEQEAEAATRVWVCFRAGDCSPGEAQA
jgi:hypothetical protein